MPVCADSVMVDMALYPVAPVAPVLVVTKDEHEL
jgi:hypothetical protein